MSQTTCSAKTKRGTDCRAATVMGSQFCALHSDPKRAAELGRMGGRKNRHYVETDDVIISPPSTPEEIKSILAQAVVDVRARRLDPRTGTALTYMASALLKAFETTDLQNELMLLREEVRTKADKP